MRLRTECQPSADRWRWCAGFGVPARSRPERGNSNERVVRTERRTTLRSSVLTFLAVGGCLYWPFAWTLFLPAFGGGASPFVEQVGLFLAAPAMPVLAAFRVAERIGAANALMVGRAGIMMLVALLTYVGRQGGRRRFLSCACALGTACVMAEWLSILIGFDLLAEGPSQ